MWIALRRAALVGAVICLVSCPVSAQTDIGVATTIQNRVEGEVDGQRVTVADAEPVFANEQVTTFEASSASLRFTDDTVLSIGPSSQIVLDRFVYDPDQGTGDILFNAAKGAFRFVTGNAASESYRVITPNAVIGSRGTDFSVYVTRLATLILGHEGNPFACPGRLRDAPDPANAVCCDLNVSPGGPPLYGIVTQRSRRCAGPFVWDGTNPGDLINRRLIRETRDSDRDDTPRRDPPPPKPDPDPEPDDDDIDID